MKKIELTQGKFAMVDDEDFEYLNQYKWFAAKQKYTYYACRKSSKINGKRHTIIMHRVIMKLDSNDLIVDHKDHDGLNNMRSNLRLCNKSQNGANSIKSIGLSSKFKGVCWNKEKMKWECKIKVSHKRLFLGYFKTEIEAAISYNNAAILHFGEFAELNIIEQHGKGTQTALAI